MGSRALARKETSWHAESVFTRKGCRIDSRCVVFLLVIVDIFPNHPRYPPNKRFIWTNSKVVTNLNDFDSFMRPLQVMLLVVFSAKEPTTIHFRSMNFFLGAAKNGPHIPNHIVCFETGQQEFTQLVCLLTWKSKKFDCNGGDAWSKFRLYETMHSKGSDKVNSLKFTPKRWLYPMVPFFQIFSS